MVAGWAGGAITSRGSSEFQDQDAKPERFKLEAVPDNRV